MDTLENHLLPSAQLLIEPDHEWIFQQDGEPAHTANSVKEPALKQKAVILRLKKNLILDFENFLCHFFGLLNNNSNCFFIFFLDFFYLSFFMYFFQHLNKLKIKN